MSNKAVYKYPVEIKDRSSILMPRNAEILRFALQNGEPFIWALVNTSPKHPHVWRYFRFAGTGHPITEKCLDYIGTIDLPGPLVFHLFEVGTEDTSEKP